MDESGFGAYLDAEIQEAVAGVTDEEATFSNSLVLKIMEERRESLQKFKPKTQPFMPITSFKIGELAKEIDPEWNWKDSTHLLDRIKSELPGVYETLNDRTEVDLLTTEKWDDINTSMFYVISGYLRDKRLHPEKFPIYGGKTAAFAAEVDTVASLRVQPPPRLHKPKSPGDLLDKVHKRIFAAAGNQKITDSALQAGYKLDALKSGFKAYIPPGACKSIATNMNADAYIVNEFDTPDDIKEKVRRRIDMARHVATIVGIKFTPLKGGHANGRK